MPRIPVTEPVPPMPRPTLAQVGSFVAMFRRAARNIGLQMDCLQACAANCQRQIALIQRATSPATLAPLSPVERQRAEKLHAYTASSVEARKADYMREFAAHGEVMKRLASALLAAAPAIDAATTLQQRCDMLGVNRSDRGLLNESDGLVRICWHHGLEDSGAFGRKTPPPGPLMRVFGFEALSWAELIKNRLITPGDLARAASAWDSEAHEDERDYPPEPSPRPTLH